MSNIPISSLPIAISLTGSEAVPLVQAGTTKSATVALINAQNIANIPAGGTTGQGLVKSSNANYATQWKTVSGFGTVQEVDTGTGLTGGPITLTGTVSLASISTGNVLANTSGISAAPTPTTPSSVLDVIGSTQGDILYRDSGGWQVLAPGNNGQILTTQGAAANPKWSAVGSGSVQSVGLSLPAIFTVSGSPVTTTGTLTGTLATQNANLVWSGPSSGVASAPTFRSLVGADLPTPSASTLGGIQSTTGASHQWISSISTSGVPGLSQPAFTDISGTVAASQLPNPTLSTLGGIEAINAVASNWVRSIDTSGVPHLSQPAFSDISGNVVLAQLPTMGNNTILSNISGGSSTPLANGLSAIIDSAISNVQGDILYRDTSSWLALAPGTSGQVLTTGGAAANPAWATVTGTGTVTSIATNNGVTGGTITTTGTIGLASITAHTVLANTTGSSAVPTASTPSSILDIIGSTEGDVLYRGASTWSALAPGTNGQFLQTTGTGSTPQWAAAVTSIATAGLATGGTITTSGTITVTAASKSDQQTGTSTTLAVTPSQQQSHDSAAKAWVSFTGSTGAILASYNVASVSRSGTGQFTVTYTNAFSSANYAASVTSNGAGIISTGNGNQLAASIDIRFTNTSNVNTDPPQGFLICFGRQ